jgi:hypothetical protein
MRLCRDFPAIVGIVSDAIGIIANWSRLFAEKGTQVNDGEVLVSSLLNGRISATVSRCERNRSDRRSFCDSV